MPTSRHRRGDRTQQIPRLGIEQPARPACTANPNNGAIPAQFYGSDSSGAAFLKVTKNARQGTSRTAQHSACSSQSTAASSSLLLFHALSQHYPHRVCPCMHLTRPIIKVESKVGAHVVLVCVLTELPASWDLTARLLVGLCFHPAQMSSHFKTAVSTAAPVNFHIASVRLQPFLLRGRSRCVVSLALSHISRICCITVLRRWLCSVWCLAEALKIPTLFCPSL